MTRANAAKEKAARLAAQRHASTVDPEQPEETTLGERPVARPAEAERKNVRLTVDLAPLLYDDFEDWRRQAARELGRGRVKSVDVVRELLRQVMADAALSRQVIDALRREGGR